MLPWDLGRMFWLWWEWVEMVEKRGKNVDSGSLLSTHPCHHFLRVSLGPWTAESIGFFFFITTKKKIWTGVPLKFL